MYIGRAERFIPTAKDAHRTLRAQRNRERTQLGASPLKRTSNLTDQRARRFSDTGQNPSRMRTKETIQRYVRKVQSPVMKGLSYPDATITRDDRRERVSENLSSGAGGDEWFGGGRVVLLGLEAVAVVVLLNEKAAVRCCSCRCDDDIGPIDLKGGFVLG